MVSSTFQPSAAAKPADNQAFSEKTVRVAGGILGYRECGSGPDVFVLLHGISSGAGSWAECAAVLGQQARVIAWDAPGYGASTQLDVSAPTATHYAQRLHALLDALNVENCLLVGHSLGALMAAAYAELPNRKANRFVLISPALGYRGAQNPQSAQVRERRLTALREQGIEGMAANLPDRLLTDKAGSAARETVQRMAMRLRPEGYTQAVELLCGDDINRYALPVAFTRAYCGEHDIVTTPEQSADYARAHGIPFGLIADAGHACYVEQPDSVARHLLEARAQFQVSATT